LEFLDAERLKEAACNHSLHVLVNGHIHEMLRCPRIVSVCMVNPKARKSQCKAAI
jgi:hypothetical protein